jgi:capsule polysaccharide export protein KpsE/RkpR
MELESINIPFDSSHSDINDHCYQVKQWMNSNMMIQKYMKNNKNTQIENIYQNRDYFENLGIIDIFDCCICLKNLDTKDCYHQL